jgi:hypothetical protein
VGTAWVGVVGAVAGVLVGTVLGHMLTSRREDKRQWLVDRRHAYADLLRAYDDVINRLGSGVYFRLRREPLAKDFWDQYAIALQRLEEVKGLVGLLAPAHVQQVVTAMNDQAIQLSKLLLMSATEPDDLRRGEQETSRARDTLLDALRADLDV